MNMKYKAIIYVCYSQASGSKINLGQIAMPEKLFVVCVANGLASSGFTSSLVVSASK